MSADEERGDATAESRLIRLRILEREVQLGCRSGEEEDLMQAAAYVDREMRELRRRNPTSSIEKIAIVTAINAASSLLAARARVGVDDDVATRVARLNRRLDELLTQEEDDATEGGGRRDGNS